MNICTGKQGKARQGKARQGKARKGKGKEKKQNVKRPPRVVNGSFHICRPGAQVKVCATHTVWGWYRRYRIKKVACTLASMHTNNSLATIVLCIVA